MAEPKTKATKLSVKAYLANIEPEQKRKDSIELDKIYSAVMGEKAKMWGTAIVGYGVYHIKKAEWPLAAFSARKQYIVLYLMPDYPAIKALVPKLGKCTTSKACVYIQKLSDINVPVLKKMILVAAKETLKRYPAGN